MILSSLYATFNSTFSLTNSGSANIILANTNADTFKDAEDECEVNGHLEEGSVVLEHSEGEKVMGLIRVPVEIDHSVDVYGVIEAQYKSQQGQVKPLSGLLKLLIARQEGVHQPD